MLKRTLIAAAVVAATLTGTTGTANAERWVKWDHCAADEVTGDQCVWDARHDGNGLGYSFLVTKHGFKKSISHRRAHCMVRLHLPGECVGKAYR